MEIWRGNLYVSLQGSKLSFFAAASDRSQKIKYYCAINEKSMVRTCKKVFTVRKTFFPFLRNKKIVIACLIASPGFKQYIKNRVT